LRLLLDQNMPVQLVEVLHDAGHEVAHTHDLGLDRAHDEAVLQHACNEQRTLITADKKLTKFLASSRARCPSVLITRDLRTISVQELGQLLAANLPNIAEVIEEQGNAVFVIAPDRPIRATVLPLGSLKE
jgi:predicted nuclease of predicted toxin-antitoxin system